MFFIVLINSLNSHVSNANWHIAKTKTRPYVRKLCSIRSHIGICRNVNTKWVSSEIEILQGNSIKEMSTVTRIVASKCAKRRAYGMVWRPGGGTVTATSTTVYWSFLSKFFCNTFRLHDLSSMTMHLTSTLYSRLYFNQLQSTSTWSLTLLQNNAGKVSIGYRI